MGTNQSQQQQVPKSVCLLHLLRRSWRIVSSAATGVKDKSRIDDADECVTDLSVTGSRCSGCKGCGYHQELDFDSESDMAPNAEEDLLVSIPRGPHSAKERLRPPTYNAEDYAIALRRWGRRALVNQNPEVSGNNHNTLPSTCTSSSSSGYASGNAGEMTLRQFTSVSELLNKLKADLRLAFPSFVQEFASAPAEGISLLLETLRGIQLSQSTPPSATQPGPRRPRARRAALDELGCVECLAVCVERCPEAARSLAQAQPGLLALAVCLTSSLNRSRILALQLLTRVCNSSGGHAAVSEAVSTLRLRYGEGGRFRFLAGALLAPKAALALRVSGISFLNAFLASAPRAQTKLYIQAEACEAGLEPRVLQEWLKYADDEDPLTELMRDEVRKWSRNCVDVDALQGRARRAEETCRVLSKKVATLQRQLQKVQMERMNDLNSGRAAKKSEVAGVRDEPVHSNPRIEPEKKVSSSAEDEGISFSERSSSPEENHLNQRPATMDNDQETTIDDVIEELRIIVKDAEEELHDWNQLQREASNPPKVRKSEFGKAPLNVKNPPVITSKARECLRSTEESARIDRDLKSTSLKIVVPGPQRSNRDTVNEEEDKESAIIPAIIHPQPPRRLPLCLASASLFLPQPILAVPEACVDDSDHEEDLLLLEDDGSDSLLSASRLNGKIIQEQQYRRRQSQSSCSELKMESLADFEISETILDERIPRKQVEPNNNSNSLGSRPYSKCPNTVQRRTERKKYLRRCQSQDHIEDSKSSRVVSEHIRKFESMNSFDERRSLPGLTRSESFHQTRRDQSLDRIDEHRSRERERADYGRYRSYNDDDDRKYTSFLDTTRKDQRVPDRSQRQTTDSSRIFAGRPHDVLGFGKNRFNAGKYSGTNGHQQQQQQFSSKSGQRHVNGSGSHPRSKVTDVLSGLY